MECHGEKVFRIKKGATPGEGAAPEVTLEEGGYFLSGIFAALSVGAIFTALSVGDVFISWWSASATLPKATATKRAQIT